MLWILPSDDLVKRLYTEDVYIVQSNYCNMYIVTVLYVTTSERKEEIEKISK